MPVETIRSLYEAFNERDLDTVVALTHPDIEIHPLRTQSPTSISGRAAFQAWLEHGVATGRTHRYEIDDIHQRDDGAVILVGRMIEHDTSLDMIGVHHLRDGLSWRAEMFFSDETTLRQLGILRNTL